MKISELQNGQAVKARWGRYRDDMDHPDWCDWTTINLFVQKHAGKVVLLAISPSWAEYTPRDFSVEYKQFENEGYYLEIDGLTDI